MDKSRVAAVLDEMGTLLELKGENPFRTRAYHNAALSLSALTEDLATMVAAGTVTDIKGIGKGLAGLIEELVTTGKCREYDELCASLPAGLPDMLRIQGLGPKRIRILHEKLHIDSITALQKACAEHRLSALDGFGAKTEENILKGIEQLAAVSSKFLYSTAAGVAASIREAVANAPGVVRCEIAGSLRRRKEIVGDIDIIASVPAKKRAPVFERFISHPLVQAVEVRGDTKASVRLANGMQCDLRLVEEDEFSFALNYFTGSKEHNVAMRSLALKRGWSLNEYSFSRSPGGKGTRPPACATEEEIYRSLGLAFIPPELREDRGEFAAAASGDLPSLITDADIRGTFHCHTTASDGLHTLEQMVEAARGLRWEYLGIADHSQSAGYAGGLTPARVKQQLNAIAGLNKTLKRFRVFAGTECDILPDGSLDFPDRVLASFDYVVASIHSKFRMTEAEATRRLVTALQNKYVTFLGHPTGRLLLQREGYPVNMTEVINAAADLGKGIEINAHPMRLDLDWRHLSYARQRGVKILINPDAHATDGLKDTYFGVGIARKGWLEPADVINTRTSSRVEQFFRQTREG